MKFAPLAIPFLVLSAAVPAAAWGLRGHTVANLAAIESLPEEGPTFLRASKAYIGHLGTVPDLWRGMSEPFLRISEDPNHGWYTESFDFIKEVPRSRTEFTLLVYDEYLRVRKTDPERAKLLNIRYTGLQAYSMMEGYERMKAGMRLYRAATHTGESPARDITALYAASSPLLKDRTAIQGFFAADIAFYIGWLGHYIADAAMPLHNSKHHDGWVGDNPGNYTRDPDIHGRFESRYVDLINVAEGDLLPYVPAKPRHFNDPWVAILDHMIEARSYAEEVYRIDQRGAFADPKDPAAREFTHRRLASGAAFLRDLIYTAWLESAKPLPVYKPAEAMNNPDNPRYNPATGSAPAPSPKQR